MNELILTGARVVLDDLQAGVLHDTALLGADLALFDCASGSAADVEGPHRKLRPKASANRARIETAFRLAYGRTPTADERSACESHLAAMTKHHRAKPPKATELPLTVKRNSVEELTGETVFWDEDLSALKKYQRDMMPWEVSAETRALAEVCLVLLNSNEFLYVR